MLLTPAGRSGDGICLPALRSHGLAGVPGTSPGLLRVRNGDSPGRAPWRQGMAGGQGLCPLLRPWRGLWGRMAREGQGLGPTFLWGETEFV